MLKPTSAKIYSSFFHCLFSLLLIFWNNLSLSVTPLSFNFYLLLYVLGIKLGLFILLMVVSKLLFIYSSSLLSLLQLISCVIYKGFINLFNSISSSKRHSSSLIKYEIFKAPSSLLLCYVLQNLYAFILSLIKFGGSKDLHLMYYFISNYNILRLHSSFIAIFLIFSSFIVIINTFSFL